MIPDAFGRAIPLAIERLISLGTPLPATLLWPWASLHEPVGWLLVCTLLAAAFVERDRARAWRALCLGAAAHTALDVTQFHHGEGYVLLAPFSARTFELGWMGSEATTSIALPLLGLTALAWAPAGIERRWGVPRVRPRWGLAVVPAVAIGAAFSWWSACAPIVAWLACWRWWIRAAGPRRTAPCPAPRADR